MHKNKVIQILKTLTPEEFIRFGNFINSPYFNTSKEIIKLFNYLKKYYPAFDNSAIDVEKISQNFYGKDKGTTAARIRNILTDLNKLTRKFLAHERFSACEFSMKSAEVFMLYDKGLINIWEKEINNYFSKFGEMNALNEPYANESISLYGLKANHLLNFGKPQKGVSALEKHSEFSGVFALQNMLESKRLEFAVECIFNMKYVNLNAKIFDLFDFDKFIEHIKIHSPKVFRIIAIEYYSLKMFLNRDFDESNSKIEEIFFASLKKEKPEILFSEIFCKNWLNALVMRMEYYADVNEIEQLAKKTIPITNFYLKKRLYKNMSQPLPIPNFVSYLYFAFKAGDSDWMKQFIQKYSGEIHPGKKEYAANFAWGLYHASKGDFDKSLSRFSQISSSEPIISSNTKSEMMYCHFKLGNYDAALSFSEAVLRGYENKGQSSLVPRWGIEFIKNFRSLIKIVSGASSMALDELQLKLKKARPRVRFEFINRKLLP